MARFEIESREALKMVRCVLDDEMVRAESGALHYMRGAIEITSSAPTVGGFLKSMVTAENIFRPTYKGTGEIYFGPPTFGEYTILELQNEEWILERGSYVCSDIGVDVGAFRNKAVSALLGGEGWFQTSVKGTGQFVLQAPGPIERLELNGDKLSVDGRFAIARTASLKFEVQKATRSVLGSLSSGEGLLSTFEGTGVVLIAPVANVYQKLIDLFIRAIPRSK